MTVARRRSRFSILLYITSATGIYAFVLPQSSFVSNRIATRATKQKSLPRWILHAAKDDDDEEESDNNPGMADAFRMLDSLDLSLDSEDQKAKPSKPIPTPVVDATLSDLPESSPEKEVKVYKDMMLELEEKDQDGLYKSVMGDMGGDASLPMPPMPESKTEKVIVEETFLGSDNSDSLQVDREEFMNKALEDALKEVSTKTPSSVDSVLNDKELMKEIEAVFDRGNEKLMDSLEDIRKEQKALAKEQSDQKAAGNSGMTEEAERLGMAEASLSAMLEKVNKETSEVERAVEDLKEAQKAVNEDFLVKLRAGGLPKQGALVGFLLFSVRSIIDTVGAFSDETLLTVALAQGIIAIVCAAVFFLL